MGLTIGTGWLALNKTELEPDEFEAWLQPYHEVRALLVANGLPAHDEPTSLPNEAIIELEMIGYGGLHFVRRMAAYCSLKSDLPPLRDEYEGVASDPVTAQLTQILERNGFRSRRHGLLSNFRKPQEFFAHLMLHSDCEGFYVPYDFEDVVFDSSQTTSNGLGGMLGSSQRLLRECQILADLIDLPVDIDPEDDALWHHVDQPAETGPAWHIYGREAFGLARLIAAAKSSIKYKTALVFG